MPHAEHSLKIPILTTERFFVLGEQVQISSSRRLVRVIPELPAFAQLGVAAEAGSGVEAFEALARKCRELALRRNGVGEEFVSSSVVAQVTVGLVRATVC